MFEKIQEIDTNIYYTMYQYKFNKCTFDIPCDSTNWIDVSKVLSWNSLNMLLRVIWSSQHSKISDNVFTQWLSLLNCWNFPSSHGLVEGLGAKLLFELLKNKMLQVKLDAEVKIAGDVAWGVDTFMLAFFFFQSWNILITDVHCRWMFNHSMNFSTDHVD